MLPRRRLMLGLIISLVILLFYLSETAFWQEYLFSPQLVVWRKRVWLVYARNPLLGREARLRVRPLEGGREQILDAARKVLFNGIQGNTVCFYLNKQVAYVGHISFSQSVGESPLGPIRVEIESDNPHAVIDWLAPKTG